MATDPIREPSDHHSGPVLTTSVPTAAYPPWCISVGFLTDVGRARERNEDAYALYIRHDGETNRMQIDAFFAVADGMGGHEAGDVASRFASDAVSKALTGAEADLPEHVPDLGGWIERLLQRINRELVELPAPSGRARGMGSTLTLAVLRDSTLFLGHVGDSRCYRLRDGTVAQLTGDHSWVAERRRAGVLTVEEEENHPEKNLLTQCLGMDRDLSAFIAEESLAEGDRFLLCSDGLHGQVRAETMAQVLREEKDPQIAVGRLVALANEAGGADNITAIVFDTERAVPLPAAIPPPASRDTLPGAVSAPPGRQVLGRVLISTGLLALVGVAGAGAWFYLEMRGAERVQGPGARVHADSGVNTVPRSTIPNLFSKE